MLLFNVFKHLINLVEFCSTMGHYNKHNFAAIHDLWLNLALFIEQILFLSLFAFC